MVAGEEFEGCPGFEWAVASSPKRHSMDFGITGHAGGG